MLAEKSQPHAKSHIWKLSSCNGGREREREREREIVRANSICGYASFELAISNKNLLQTHHYSVVYGSDTLDSSSSSSSSLLTVHIYTPNNVFYRYFGWLDSTAIDHGRWKPLPNKQNHVTSLTGSKTTNQNIK